MIFNYHIHIMSFSSYDRSSCFQRGFIAQLVECCTGGALGFIWNCLSYFTTARITFTCIIYPQCTHMIYIIYTSIIILLLKDCFIEWGAGCFCLFCLEIDQRLRYKTNCVTCSTRPKAVPSYRYMLVQCRL